MQSYVLLSRSDCTECRVFQIMSVISPNSNYLTWLKLATLAKFNKVFRVFQIMSVSSANSSYLTWLNLATLAMNGGQVQDPKLRTRGRPGLAKSRSFTAASGLFRTKTEGFGATLDTSVVR